MTTEAMSEAKWALIEAIYKHAQFAATFELQSDNIDRPIAETPWLADYRYGDGEYDARWYSVQGAKTHFIEGLAGAIEDALAIYAAVAFMAGQSASPEEAQA